MDILAKKLVFVFLIASAAAPAFAADIANGKQLATKTYICTSCHGADFNSPIAPEFPKLAGQHADYLEHALTSYKETDNAAIGRKNAVMVGQAARLSRDEIADMSAYIASLPSSLLVHH